MLSLDGESGILFLMNAILNYDTLLLIPAIYSIDINKCAPHIEGVTPHNFAYIRNREFAASRVI